MSSTTPQSNNTSSRKRKAPIAGNNHRPHKYARLNNARKISSQTSDKAFSEGNLNVDKFVKAREYEIKALEDGLRKSKAVLSQRAFQDVPKDLRRRTASHNVKWIPKRLRPRAAKEMVEDNTPTVTARRRKPSTHQRLRLETAKRLQKLSVKSKERRQEKKAQQSEAEVKVSVEGEEPKQASPALSVCKPRVKMATLKTAPIPKAKFKKRQIHKTWLPTHLWHSKRAHMTPPKEPLWRFALPLTPTAKCYRTTHRATTQRGAVAWDMSYMSTIGLDGPEKSIEGLLKALGVGADGDGSGAWGKSGLKWRQGTRTWEGWLHEREEWPAKRIAPATVIWNAKTQPEEDVLVAKGEDAPPNKSKENRKVSIRVHPAGFMQLWEQVIRLGKVQKPTVTVEDLRFEIGSIEISGPNAAEALVGILHPESLAKGGTDMGNLDGAHDIWHYLSNQSPSSLPPNILLAFEASDPRLRHPPRTIQSPADLDTQKRIRQICTTWPLDSNPRPATLFERSNRLKSQRSLPSQKSINRRKTLADPGQYPKSRPNDPKIPTLVFASRGNTATAGTWTILLPWKCIEPVWRSLMYYPLAIGGSVRFGGVREKRQIAFESGSAWFPGDFPGTKAGDEWELQEKVKRKAEWEKRPKGRRVEWDSLDLGMGRKGEIGTGWACDWQILGPKPTEADADVKEIFFESLPRSFAAQLVAGKSTESIHPPHALITVEITMITKGVPQTCARIYRLPTANIDLRAKWLAQVPTPASKRPSVKKAPTLRRPGADAPLAEHKGYAAALIMVATPSQVGSADYPPVPDEDDLIGFVTTGKFNLGEGKGSGIASLLLEKVVVPNTLVSGEDHTALKKEHTLCIVRDAGQSIGRLAKWELAL
ncbi:POPLD-domain-containing protein [Tothia fuscella]|uniref:POPLD-domain-containing protein n=1 Tax=Tothia fuscella TaxID=1048955 RepID=A0A9P4NS79_9PEZI|nr:POPLD-domain-containing protein [Tothia fuscella]